MTPVASIVPPRTLGFADARALLLFLIMLTVGACAQLDRLPAVGVADTDRASVAGISEARFMANDTAALAAFGRRLYERESKYFSSLGRPIPPEALLAISGGGDNGAFGAGVLVGWSESRTRPSFKIVTGISTGALIAPLAFVGPEYDPLLAEMYTTIGQSDIFEKRPVLAGLVSDALADSMPLRNLIAKYVDAKLVARIAEESRRGRALVIITTNLDAGVPVIWNIGAIAESGRPEAIGLIRNILLASASVPGFFPPVMFDVMVDGIAHQEMHVDGGASMQTFLYPAALQVRKIPNGGGARPRIGYVIRNGRLTQGWDEVARSTPTIATRAVATLTTNSGVGDLYRIYALAKRDGVRRIGLARALARHCDPDSRLPLEDGRHGAAPFLFDGTVDNQRTLRPGARRAEKQDCCQKDADLRGADSCRQHSLVHGGFLRNSDFPRSFNPHHGGCQRDPETSIVSQRTSFRAGVQASTGFPCRSPSPRRKSLVHPPATFPASACGSDLSWDSRRGASGPASVLPAETLAPSRGWRVPHCGAPSRPMAALTITLAARPVYPQ